MKYTYRMRIDTVCDEEQNILFTYGIEAVNQDNEVITSISDVFLDRERAERFIERCNRGELSTLHLRDAVEDAILE